MDDLIQKTGLPQDRVYKVICLPPISKREGCALLQPPASDATTGHPYLKSMLDALGKMRHYYYYFALFLPRSFHLNTKLCSYFFVVGGCVECPNDDVMNAMMIPGCMMGSMYGVMKNNRDWLGEQCVIVFFTRM